jgi:hypothetical protein
VVVKQSELGISFPLPMAVEFLVEKWRGRNLEIRVVNQLEGQLPAVPVAL